jgi:N-acetylmuramoyl-L-alanine amidase
MKRIALLALSIIIALVAMPAGAVFAREGDSGYEGGISSGEVPGKTSFDYQEVCFIT